MTARRLLLALLLALAALPATGAEEASACSCADIDRRLGVGGLGLPNAPFEGGNPPSNG